MDTARTDTERRARRFLLPRPESVRASRHFIGDVLTKWQLDRETDTVTLLASEVVTNAVVHAATPAILDLVANLADRELCVAVTDFSNEPVLNPIASLGLRSLLVDPDLDAESGRGLMIVAALADRWGIETTPPGKTVWFAVSLSAP